MKERLREREETTLANISLDMHEKDGEAVLRLRKINMPRVISI